MLQLMSRIDFAVTALPWFRKFRAYSKVWPMAFDIGRAGINHVLRIAVRIRLASIREKVRMPPPGYLPWRYFHAHAPAFITSDWYSQNIITVFIMERKCTVANNVVVQIIRVLGKCAGCEKVKCDKD